MIARAYLRCECTGECGGLHGGLFAEGRCLAAHLSRIIRDPMNPGAWWPAGAEPPHLRSFAVKVTRVVLTVAHLNHVEDDSRPENLRAMCQRCHLKLDRADNQARRHEGTNAAKGQLPLPTLAAMPEHRRRAP